MRIVTILAALLLCGTAAAADKPCSKADAGNVQKTLDRSSNWAQMQKTWKDFGHCDADATADQFTDALLRLIIDWKEVDAFAAAMKDEQFRAFVTTHLRSPAAKDDIADVYARAKSSCPKGQDAFCAQLADIVKPGK